MRLAPSRLRFTQSSSSASPHLFSRASSSSGFDFSAAEPARAFSPFVYPIRHGTRTSRRALSIVASPVPIQPAPGRDHNVAEVERSAATSSATETTTPPIVPYSHLKRRGPFLPSRSTQDVAQPPADASSGRWGLQQYHGQLMLNSQHYGKWQELLFDYDRLMFESGLVPSSFYAQKARRSVDQPEHASDIGLWSAIFNFAQRRGDGDASLVVWREIFQRRQLHQVEGIVARAFWHAVLEAALMDDVFLASTWAYAEWMHDTHGALWPNYYRTVVTYCLENGEYGRALHWHLRLSPHFAVTKRDFFDMIKGFLTDPDPDLQDVLHSIYSTSHHRVLYDTVVPLLWSRGHSALAAAWRETFVRHDDRPTSSASRPFLQYVAGYYPEIELCTQEQAIANSRPAQYLESPQSKPESKTTGLPTNLFYLMNRVHGETFGIQEKSFNDKMGSKWFATSWVSLDTAINLVFGLGVNEIGPLSLQSIALREGNPAGVLRRIEQLEQCQIGIGQSNYARAVRHFAKIGDAETLDDLLRSTLHPEVFDDVVLQRYALGSASFTNDWKTHRLLLAVRLAVSEDAMVATSNQLLLACLDKKKKNMALRLLDEFSARGIELLPSICDAISDLILAEVPRHVNTHGIPDVDFYAAICRRLAILRLPVATEAWQNILYVLGRQGRLANFETVTLEVIDRYRSFQSATLPTVSVSSTSLSPSSDETTAFKVHIADVPEIMRGEQKRQQTVDIGYRLLPRDMPLNHPLHPLSLIFNSDLVASIVRWFFHRKSAYRQRRDVRVTARQSRPKQDHGRERQPGKSRSAALAGASRTKASTPQDFSLAGGIRLIAMLRSRGVDIPVSSVRSEALVCIGALFGPESMATRYWQPARSMNQLTLREVKELCDAAWVLSDEEKKDMAGGVIQEEPPLLPALEVLEKALEAIKPVAATFGNQLSRRGDKKKASRDAFIEAVAHQT